MAYLAPWMAYQAPWMLYEYVISRILSPFPSVTLRCLHPQACKFIPGPELIQMEPGEAVEKLRLAIRVLANFKQFYFEYRGKSAAEVPGNPWKFQNR